MRIIVTLPPDGKRRSFPSLKKAEDYITLHIPPELWKLVKLKVVKWSISHINIESHILSDGRAEVAHIGNLWFFSRFYAGDVPPPEKSDIITKEEAYKRLEEALKANTSRDNALEMD